MGTETYFQKCKRIKSVKLVGLEIPQERDILETIVSPIRPREINLFHNIDTNLVTFVVFITLLFS